MELIKLIHNRYIKEVGIYITALCMCMVTLAWVMKLWDADLDIPFSYDGDGLFTSMVVKGLIDNGWVQHNNFIGFPGGQVLYDFPINNYIDIIILKLLTFILPNYAATMNTYYLLTFPLTTVAAMFVFRQLNVSYGLSIFGSLLYTFLPYHFLRSEPHLGLAAYYMIPLMILVILWLCEGKSVIVNRNNELKWDFREYHSIMSIIICILVSYTFIYYSFFSCFFLLVAGTTTYISQRNKSALLSSIILISIIIIGVLVGASPTLIYQHENGKNFDAVTRFPSESEVYGLKIIQLLMPINGHRIPLLAKISSYYSGTAPLVNENKAASLGIFGSIGFLALIAWAFYLLSKGPNLNCSNIPIMLNNLSVLNLSAVLLATIGGFGSIFAYLVFYEIRCYNRISIYIAFFSLLVIVIFFRNCSRKYVNSHTKRLLFNAIICLALVVGVLDQTSNSFMPPYTSIKTEYLNDENFVKNIEAIMPENAMIFQLPYVHFPGCPPVYKMAEHSHLRGYLHSLDLRWSYGTMMGRPWNDWQRIVASMPVGDMLKTLSETGFQGIYIDSYGFQDDGPTLISDIRQILGVEPLISNNQRLYFFDMTLYNKKIKATTSKNGTIIAAFDFGWYGNENLTGTQTRWMQADATIIALSPVNRTANLSLQALSFNRNRTLEISASGVPVAWVAVPTGFINMSVPLQLAKGANIVRLHVPEGCERPCDIRGVNSSDDRCLSMAVRNLIVV